MNNLAFGIIVKFLLLYKKNSKVTNMKFLNSIIGLIVDDKRRLEDKDVNYIKECKKNIMGDIMDSLEKEFDEEKFKESLMLILQDSIDSSKNEKIIKFIKYLIKTDKNYNENTIFIHETDTTFEEIVQSNEFNPYELLSEIILYSLKNVDNVKGIELCKKINLNFVENNIYENEKIKIIYGKDELKKSYRETNKFILYNGSSLSIKSTMLIIGEWNDNSSEDKKLIKDLSNVNYLEFLEYIQNNYKDDYYIKEQYYVINEDMMSFDYLVKNIHGDMIYKIIDIIEKYFMTSNKYKISSLAMANLLKFISAYTNNNLDNSKISNRIFEFETKILNSNKMESIELYFIYSNILIESYPNNYMCSLERSLEQENSCSKKILEYKKDYWINSDLINQVGLALRKVSMYEKHFPISMKLLYKLASINSNFINTISSSLIEYGNYSEVQLEIKIKLLESYFKKYPDITWEAIMNLLSNSSYSLIILEKPFYLPMTNYNCNNNSTGIKEMINLLIDNCNSENEIIELIESSYYFKKEEKNKFKNKLEICKTTLNKVSLEKIWNLVKDEIDYSDINDKKYLNEILLLFQYDEFLMNGKRLFNNNFDSNLDLQNNFLIELIKTKSIEEIIELSLNINNKKEFYKVLSSNIDKEYKEFILNLIMNKEGIIEAIQGLLAIEDIDLYKEIINDKKYEKILKYIPLYDQTIDLMENSNNKTLYIESFVCYNIEKISINKLKMLLKQKIDNEKVIELIDEYFLKYSIRDIIIEVYDYLINFNFEEYINIMRNALDDLCFERILKNIQENIEDENKILELEIKYFKLYDRFYNQLDIKILYFRVTNDIELFKRIYNNSKNSNESNNNYRNILEKCNRMIGENNGNIDYDIVNEYVNYKNSQVDSIDQYNLSKYIAKYCSYCARDKDFIIDLKVANILDSNEDILNELYMELLNKRGSYNYDPEHKEGKKLSTEYYDFSTVAEKNGLFNFSIVLKKIAEDFKNM